MIVTISRELGAGGLSIGEALARDLDGTLLDERTLIAELAARGGFTAEYLERIDERPPSLASTFVTDIARAAALVQAMDVRSTEEAVHNEIRAIVLEHAQRANVVLIGHGGVKLLADVVARTDIFALLLHARRAWRVEQVMRRFAIDREEADLRIRRTDDLRKRYIAHFFKSDLYDAHNYDLVIDTERIGIDASIGVARAAVQAATRVP